MFFSVKHDVLIGGVRFRPTVCYALSSRLKEVIQKLVSEDKAALYDKEVRFVTGKAYPVKEIIKNEPVAIKNKELPGQHVLTAVKPSFSSVAAAQTDAPSKKRKKQKREFS